MSPRCLKSDSSPSKFKYRHDRACLLFFPNDKAARAALSGIVISQFRLIFSKNSEPCVFCVRRWVNVVHFLSRKVRDFPFGAFSFSQTFRSQFPSSLPQENIYARGREPIRTTTRNAVTKFEIRR